MHLQAPCRGVLIAGRSRQSSPQSNAWLTTHRLCNIRVICCRHAYGDQYQATDLVIPGAGRVELVYYPQDGSEAQRHTVYQYEGAGQAHWHAAHSCPDVAMPQMISMLSAALRSTAL